MVKKVKILYIDDEPNNLNGFKATFRFDYHILLAATLEQAVDILSHENDIIIILSDQRMPQKTGIQFFEEIKMKFPKPIRMLITGYADIEATIDAVNRGQIFRYIKKPWTDTAIKNAIEDAIEYYSLRNFEWDSIFLEKNGYIIWDMRNDKRSMFIDLLKGFEEYAQLKGYHVTLSSDTSIPNKIAFKFTFSNDVNEKSKCQKGHYGIHRKNYEWKHI